LAANGFFGGTLPPLSFERFFFCFLLPGIRLVFASPIPRGESMRFLDRCGRFAAILAWQLGGLPAEPLAVMRVTAWAFALCFAAITVVSWRYLFILPVVVSFVITVCLTVAAWLSGKAIRSPE
jgi:hypothetical protein